MAASISLGPNEPTELGGYRLVSRLAQGGQGVVYLALDSGGGQVVVKLLHSDWLSGPGGRARMVKEVAAARRVAQFCTAQVIEAQLDSDPPFIVSEYVNGPSLAEHIHTSGPLAGTALDRLAVGTATALVAIHQAKVVHRDFKPGNVVLGPDGPRVIDFGIARDLDAETTTGGGLIGTPAYMAPEQLSGKAAGPPSDLFAWAATIAFAATGRNPFQTTTINAAMREILFGEPDLNGVPAALGEILTRCLVKDPDQRPTAQQVLLLLLHEPMPAPGLIIRDDTLTRASQLTVPAQTVPVRAVGLPSLPGTVRDPVLDETTAPSPHSPRGQLLDPNTEPSPRSGTVSWRRPPTWPGSSRWFRPARPVVVGTAVITIILATAVGIGISRRGDAGSEQGSGAPDSGALSSATSGSTDGAGPLGPGAGASTGSGSSPGPGASAGVDKANPLDPFEGRWVGVGFQAQGPGGPISWPVTITLSGPPIGGKIELPSLGCEGVLSLIPPAPTAHEVRLRHVTTLDPDRRCASGGNITLILVQDDSVEFFWQSADNAGNTASATLTRT